MKKKLFGTSGIRGHFPEDVNGILAINIGKAIGTYLGGKGDVVVGYDPRTSNKVLDNGISSGLIETGCNVIKLGMVPTGLTGFATEMLNCSCGIMITASHNPSTDNGVKIWNKNGMAFTSSQEDEIEEIYNSNSFITPSWNNVGKIYHNNEIIKDYIDKLLSLVKIKKGLKVLIDSASGAGSELSPIIFRMAGCEVITLNSQVDGFFPGRKAEPNKNNLGDLMQLVPILNADLGIAHDGDADRMITVDENGEISDFDKLLGLISKEMVIKTGDTIVTTVDAGLAIDEAVGSRGKIFRSEVGDVHVAELMEKENASFGGEPSGTWIHPEFSMCPDGILSGLKIAEIVSKKGKLSQLLNEIPSYPNERVKLPCSKEEKVLIMDEVKKSIKNEFNDIIEVSTIDGLRLTFKDGSWVLIRPSGTEDYFRITLEGKTQERADFIQKTSENFINNLIH
ncbi:phosphoglucosamine mutase [Methanobrevibacter curvatus]|uniref:Phosphoglucosamine mutase n=1 Tax=Methanobrevibacter curvatus TaxID=49547 RepID=A0A166CN41_9EURY|nr:phosphoglucosamine mutase [Methanobrevibacter curvatus]KZX14684.1 phosphoglucosamine mutase [Methanobrevibacter curvatus]